MKEGVHYNIDANGCWIWARYIRPNGYGRMWVKENLKIEYAHRVAWATTFGQIPKGKVICHKCDIRACVNPSHLFIGTQGDNVRDCVKKGRQKMLGEMNPEAKLSRQVILKIREMASFGIPQIEIAKIFNISKSNCSAIILKKTWTHI